MKYDKYLAKLEANPELAEQIRQRTLELQRKRYQNPEVRRRHAIACKVWRLNKIAGITKRKEQAPHIKADLPVFRDASFLINFLEPQLVVEPHNSS